MLGWWWKHGGEMGLQSGPARICRGFTQSPWGEPSCHSPTKAPRRGFLSGKFKSNFSPWERGFLSFNAYSGKTTNLKNKQSEGTSAKAPLWQKRRWERTLLFGYSLEEGCSEILKAKPLFLCLSQRVTAASLRSLSHCNYYFYRLP